MNSGERRVLDSSALQRLRHIHQLSLTYLLYPGATHRRFEHSLGVMELASRVFDVLTDEDRIHRGVRDLLPPRQQRGYWRSVLRMAALCHDVGHLPFSHGAEAELLPSGVDHDHLTRTIILGDELSGLWKDLKLQAEDVAKLAVGKHKAPDMVFSPWETMLSEIISGDAFGVDRVDYLLRDSHHTGVAYGRFDYHRLIDTLRILPSSQRDREDTGEREPVIGIEEGGIHTAEALLLARYFMYTQVYFHDVRSICDIHLCDFLREWLDEGVFPTDIARFIEITDNEVTAALLDAARNSGARTHELAKRIVNREFFRPIYWRNPEDYGKNAAAARCVYEAACTELGQDNVRYCLRQERDRPVDFPVERNDDKIVSVSSISDILRERRVPLASAEAVYVSRGVLDKARRWLDERRERIIGAEGESDGEVGKGSHSDGLG